MFTRRGITHVGRKFVAVTPSDSTILAPGAMGIYVGGAGAIAVKDIDGVSVTFSAVPVGTQLSISPSQILSTGTTATNLVLVY